MNVKTAKKLTLNKTTIARLEKRELEKARGGGLPWIDTKQPPTIDCGG